MKYFNLIIIARQLQQKNHSHLKIAATQLQKQYHSHLKIAVWKQEIYLWYPIIAAIKQQ